MTQEELITFLKQNLKIELDDYYEGGECWGHSGFKVTLRLGDEEISSSTFILESSIG